LETKDNSIKYVLSKFDFDLYKESDNVKSKSYQVKRINLPNNGIAWNLIENDIVFLTIDSINLRPSQKKFLLSTEGFKLLLAFAKDKTITLETIKKQINKEIKAAKTIADF